MPGLAQRLLAGPARLPLLPSKLRAGYALVMKRLWRVMPRRVLAQVDRVGPMWVDPNDFLGARLFFYRTWEPTMSAFMAERLKPGDVMIDVGANVGYYSRLASKTVGPAGKVYAVEPSPVIGAKLRDNISFPGAGNVTLVPYGISDRAERRAFTHATGNIGASAFGETVAEGGLELRRLEDVIAPDDLARVKLIKVDVEGMEAAVLADMATLLARLPADVVILCELRASPEAEAAVAKFIDAGFVTVLLENEYSMFAYARGDAPKPHRIDSLPEGQHDIALVPASVLPTLNLQD